MYKRQGGDPVEVSLANLVGSVHEGLSCTDCHTGIHAVPLSLIHISEPTRPY